MASVRSTRTPATSTSTLALPSIYRAQPEEIVPPEEAEGARDTFFNDVEWSPNKDRFDLRVAGRDIRERIADVYGDLARIAGSADRSRYT